MPAALPYVAAALVEDVVIKAIVFVVTSYAVADYQRGKAEARQRRAAELARHGRNITIRSAIAPATVVLGTARTSGPLMYAEFVGAEQEYLDTIVAVNYGELDAVLGVYIGDEFIAAADISSQIPVTGKYSDAGVPPSHVESEFVNGSPTTSATLPYAPVAGSVSSVVLDSGYGIDGLIQSLLTLVSVVGSVVTWAEPVTGKVRITYQTLDTRRPLKVQWALGSDTQPTTTWSGVSTPKWTSSHRLRGWAYVRTLKLIDLPVFAADTFDVGVLARGPVGVYDPRTDSTVDGTSNPALLAAWFRMRPRSEGGCGVPSTWIDWPSVSAAANVCDELITVKQLDGTGYENVKRYECNTVLDLSRAPEENLRNILDTMAGDFPFTGGKYRCFAGVFRAATVTLTDADIDASSDIVFAPLSSSKAPPNVMGATIYDAARNYQQVPAPAVVNSTYVADDGGEEPDELELGVTDTRQANYLQGVMLERARPALEGRCTVTGKGADIALMDTVQFALTGYTALAGKTFEVRRRSNQWNGRYPLELREVKASTYALDADRFVPPTEPASSDNSMLFDVVEVADLAGEVEFVTQVDGTKLVRVLITWTRHPQSMVTEGGTIQLRWKRSGGQWVYGAPVPGAAESAYTDWLQAGVVLLVQARAVNSQGASGPWCPLIAVPVGTLPTLLALVQAAGPFSFSTMA